eukprot:TRINITY_DN3460_c2_g1_i10.p1 TRINITY_DN3460_c2_g1~~TRINITY_DN3460_c2_g1_i10.p1  ORF type:complete len:1834 (-),score=807.04 TRINITY_DN3460_c2_g1_i10:148-5649(-)
MGAGFSTFLESCLSTGGACRDKMATYVTNDVAVDVNSDSDFDSDLDFDNEMEEQGYKESAEDTELFAGHQRTRHLHPPKTEIEKQRAMQMYHIAVENNNLELVETCIDTGLFIDQMNGEGYTPLQIALLRGHHQVAVVLIEGGANCCILTEENLSLMHITVMKCKEKIKDASFVKKMARVISLLRTHGCDASFQNNDGLIAYDLARKLGSEDLTNVSNPYHLHNAVFDMDSGKINNVGLLEELLAVPGQDVDIRNEEGKSALHVAAEKGAMECAEFLVEYGANVLLKDNMGLAPKNWAIFNGKQELANYLTTAEMEYKQKEAAKRKMKLKELGNNDRWRFLKVYRPQVLYFAFLFLLAVVVLSRTGSDIHGYYFKTLIETNLGLDGETFRNDVTEIALSGSDAFWTYLKEQVIPNLFEGDGSRLTMDYSELVGAMRLRQLRVKNNTCFIPQFSLAKHCYSGFDSTIESTDAFGPNLMFKHRNDLGYQLSAGTFGLYPSGGFVQDIPASANINTSLTILENLESNNWIDKQTRVVIVDISLYNPNINTLATARFFNEFPSTGGYLYSSRIEAMHITPWYNGWDYLFLLLELGLLVFVIYYAIKVGQLLHRQRRGFFYDTWNVLDLFISSMFLFTFSFRLAYLGLTGTLLAQYEADRSAYVFFEPVSVLFRMERDIMAIVTILCWVRLIKYTQQLPHIGPFVLTVAKMSQDLVMFIAMSVVVLVGVGLAFMLTFGTQAYGFRNFGSALFTLFRAVFGDFELLNTISNPTMGTFLFICHELFTGIILLNLLVAILNDTYSRYQKLYKIQWRDAAVNNMLAEAGGDANDEIAELMKEELEKEFGNMIDVGEDVDQEQKALEDDIKNMMSKVTTLAETEKKRTKDLAEQFEKLDDKIETTVKQMTLTPEQISEMENRLEMLEKKVKEKDSLIEHVLTEKEEQRLKMIKDFEIKLAVIKKAKKDSEDKLKLAAKQLRADLRSEMERRLKKAADQKRKSEEARDKKYIKLERMKEKMEVKYQQTLEKQTEKMMSDMEKALESAENQREKMELDLTGQLMALEEAKQQSEMMLQEQMETMRNELIEEMNNKVEMEVEARKQQNAEWKARYAELDEAKKNNDKKLKDVIKQQKEDLITKMKQRLDEASSSKDSLKSTLEMQYEQLRLDKEQMEQKMSKQLEDLEERLTKEMEEALRKAEEVRKKQEEECKQKRAVASEEREKMIADYESKIRNLKDSHEKELKNKLDKAENVRKTEEKEAKQRFDDLMEEKIVMEEDLRNQMKALEERLTEEMESKVANLTDERDTIDEEWAETYAQLEEDKKASETMLRSEGKKALEALDRKMKDAIAETYAQLEEDKKASETMLRSEGKKALEALDRKMKDAIAEGEHRLAVTIEQHKQAYQELQSDKDEMETKLQQLMKQQEKRMRQELVDQENESRSIQEELEAAFEADIERLHQDYAEQLHLKDLQKDQMEAQYQQEIEDIKAAKEGRESELTGTQSELTKWQKSVREATRENERLHKQVDKLNAKISKNTDQWNKKRLKLLSELEGLHESVRSLTASNGAIELQLFAQKQQNEALERQNREVLAENTKLKADAVDIEELHGEIARLEKRIDKIMPELEELRAAKAEAEKKVYKPKRDKIDNMLAELLVKLIHLYIPSNFARISEGMYRFGSKVIRMQILNGQLMARVGGGFTPFSDYAEKYGQIECRKLERKGEPGRLDLAAQGNTNIFDNDDLGSDGDITDLVGDVKVDPEDDGGWGNWLKTHMEIVSEMSGSSASERAERAEEILGTAETEEERQALQTMIDEQERRIQAQEELERNQAEIGGSSSSSSSSSGK